MSLNRQGIFEYIDVFYNRKRRYSVLGHASPIEYEICSYVLPTFVEYTSITSNSSHRDSL